jgi:hypothetical protein
MLWKWVSCFVATVFIFPALVPSQTLPSACPVEILGFNPSGITVQIRNTSGKTIVGLVFDAAISDATEHWKWLHWGFDESRPLRDFGWNKAIKPNAKKRLTWTIADLDFEHAGGGAFVLTSVLFEDGSSWEERTDGSSCKCFWYKHKKSAFRPVQFPPRK